MRYLVHGHHAEMGMLRVNRPRQRSLPCARYLVSRSAHFTMPMPARTESDMSVSQRAGEGITDNYQEVNPVPTDLLHPVPAVRGGHRVPRGSINNYIYHAAANT